MPALSSCGSSCRGPGLCLVLLVVEEVDGMSSCSTVSVAVACGSVPSKSSIIFFRRRFSSLTSSCCCLRVRVNSDGTTPGFNLACFVGRPRLCSSVGFVR
uniref:Putative secreted protein n=1 Tax=Ixodes ricinus TaxID=34613 RepID=A0A6B0UEP4_IXORI